VSKDRALKRIFAPKRDEVTGEWRRLRYQEIYNLYFSPYIILVIKSRRMRWAEHVASMERGEVQKGFCWGNQMERDYLENPGLHGWY